MLKSMISSVLLNHNATNAKWRNESGWIIGGKAQDEGAI